MRVQAMTATNGCWARFATMRPTGIMKRSHIIMAAGGALALAVGAWLISGARKSDAAEYRFATVERDDLEATVSSTGTLSAVTTVQVGTQVSGKVVAIHADFNDRVKKGQLIAQIDPLLLRADRARCAGRPGAQPGAARADAARIRAQQAAVRTQGAHRDRVQHGEVRLRRRARERQIGAGHARARTAESRLHQHLCADRRRGRGARCGRRTDGGCEPLGAAAVPDRQRPVADADPRVGGRKRHRRDPRRAVGALHRAGVSERDLHR